MQTLSEIHKSLWDTKVDIFIQQKYTWDEYFYWLQGVKVLWWTIWSVAYMKNSHRTSSHVTRRGHKEKNCDWIMWLNYDLSHVLSKITTLKKYLEKENLGCVCACVYMCVCLHVLYVSVCTCVHTQTRPLNNELDFLYRLRCKVWMALWESNILSGVKSDVSWCF